MPYLTHGEYMAMETFASVRLDEFPKLLNVASDVIDNITNHYYEAYPIEEDLNVFRKNQFLKAVACQIGYLKEVGASSTNGVNNNPQSVSIGRTTVSKGNSTSAQVSKSLLTNDAVNYLYPTGLLYSGRGRF